MGAPTIMRKYNVFVISIVFVSVVAVCMTIHRQYRRWHARKYIEYRGEYLLRKPPGLATAGILASIAIEDGRASEQIAAAPLAPEMKEQLIPMIDSFLSAFGSSNPQDYVDFRFQKTSQQWTSEADPNKLKRQLPMWPELLGMTNLPVPPLSLFPELITKVRQYREEDGSAVFCFPCITQWHSGSLALLSFKTNTIDRGFTELHDTSSLISKNQGGSSKQTFLAYPQKAQFPTLLISFVVETLRSKGKDIIVLQAVWLDADKRWIPVGIGVAPHSGYISYPF